MVFRFFQFISNIFTPIFNLFSLFKKHRNTTFEMDTEKVKLVLSPRTTKDELKEIVKKLKVKEIIMDFSQSKFYNNGFIKTIHLQLKEKDLNGNYFNTSMQLPALFLFFANFGFQMYSSPTVLEHFKMGIM